MTTADIRHLRLCCQHIVGPEFEHPADVVRWMGAVQAQDYGQAAWALGLRMRRAVAEDIDRALADGALLRTHVLRPTWHFVSPQDIRWLLALTGPRIKAGIAHRYRQLELDDDVFAQANEAMAKALEGGISLTRDELGRVLEEASIETSTPQRLPHMLMRAELDGVICSGPKRGKRFTYALLDERAPRHGVKEREEAIAELVRRYFESHGPATVHDFAWWSGLTTSDARIGLRSLNGQIVSERIGEKEYWLSRDSSVVPGEMPALHMLPAFDEYTVAYADRRELLQPEHFPRSSSVMLGPVVVEDGHVVGSWRRTFKKGSLVIEVDPFLPRGDAQDLDIAAAASRYGEFLDAPAVVLP